MIMNGLAWSSMPISFTHKDISGMLVFDGGWVVGRDGARKERDGGRVLWVTVTPLLKLYFSTMSNFL